MQRIDPANEQVKLSFVTTKAQETELDAIVALERSRRKGEPVTRSMVLRKALAIGFREMKRSR